MSDGAAVGSEPEVGNFLDPTTQGYLSLTGADGVLHVGYFTEAADGDYCEAARRTSNLLAFEAGIDGSATVLDVGCGGGNFLFQVAAATGCRARGLDLSIERISLARQRLAELGAGARLDVDFAHGSATALPYEPASFTHVISQDSLFLVQDKPRSHAEIFRVLRPGGILAFCDLLQPVARIGERAREHVYDRFRWSGGYSLVEYQQALIAAGFEIVLARNLGRHLRQTYSVLGQTAITHAVTTMDAAARNWLLAFAESCEEIRAAIDDGEFGWGVVVARKPGAWPPGAWPPGAWQRGQA